MPADVDFVESKMRHQIMRFTCALDSKIKFLEKFISVGKNGSEKFVFERFVGRIFSY